MAKPAFDPSKSFETAKAEKPAFDPSAPIEKVEGPSKIESGIRGLAQGASFGLADEAAGAVGALKSLLTDEKLTDAYRRERDESRANYDAAEKENPGTYLAGQLASVAVPGAGSLGAVGRVGEAASLTQKVLGAAKAGAAMGAVQGLGSSTADLTKGDVKGAAEDTAMGAGVGGLLGGVTDLVGHTIKAVAKKVDLDPIANLRNFLGPKPSKVEGKQGEALDEAIKLLDGKGLFKTTETKADVNTLNFKEEARKILPPTRKEFLNRIQEAKETFGKQISNVFETMDNYLAEKPELAEGINDIDFTTVANMLKEQRPGLAQPAAKVAAEYADKISSATTLSALQQIKRNVSQEIRPLAYFAPEDERFGQKVLMSIRNLVKTKIEQESDKFATVMANDSNVAGALPFTRNYVKDLNRVDGALISVEDILNKSVNKDPEMLKTLGRAAALGTAGYAFGGQDGAQLATLLGAGYRAMKDPRGQFMVAQAKKAAQAIPRSVTAAKTWLQQNIENLSPEVAQAAQGFMNARTQTASELALRALITQSPDMFEHSDYSSEIDGKISDPKDKQMYINKVRDETTNPIEIAKKLSQLNKNGSIESSKKPMGNPKRKTLDDVMKGY